MLSGAATPPFARFHKALRRQAAALVAEGRSNPQVAQALFVSRATVESHLRNIFRKLDVTSRD